MTAAEVDRNLADELGALSGGIPHLELMRSGYRDELGIDTAATVPFDVTRSFVHSIGSLFARGHNAHLAGVLLGFEATAVEEFRVVRLVLLRYVAAVGVTVTAGSHAPTCWSRRAVSRSPHRGRRAQHPAAWTPVAAMIGRGRSA